MKNQIDLSISLISYNSKSLLYDCLTSIYKNTKRISFEVLLTDNGSRDGTPEMVTKKFPKVKIIRNKTNLIFTRAHNMNLKKVQGRYFLVLNEDTQILPQSLDKIIAFMDKNPHVALSSCRQVDEYRETNITSERFPNPLYEIFEKAFIGRFVMRAFRLKKAKKMLEYYRYVPWDRTTIRRVDVIPGSFFLGRRSLLTTVGFFDENLLLYYEEPDYCQRAKIKGHLAYHVGNVTIVHLKSKAIVSNLTPLKRYQIAEHDMLVYYRKYFGFFWWLLLWIMFRPNWLYWNLNSLKTQAQ